MIGQLVAGVEIWDLQQVEPHKWRKPWRSVFIYSQDGFRPWAVNRVFVCCLWDRVFYSPGWLQTYCIAEGDLELMNLPPPLCAGVNRIPPPCLFYAVKPKALCHWASTLTGWAAPLSSLLPSFDLSPFLCRSGNLDANSSFLSSKIIVWEFTPTKMFCFGFLLLQNLCFYKKNISMKTWSSTLRAR